MKAKGKGIVRIALMLPALAGSMLLQGCKENYSNGEKVGNLIEFTRKGVIYDSWEGRLNLTQTGMNTSGEPFSFSFDNDRTDQDSIIELMKQAQVVGSRVIAAQCFGNLVTFSLGEVGIVFRKGWRSDEPKRFFVKSEEASAGRKCHAGAVGFSVCTVARDVRRGDEHFLEEFAVHVGFVFPSVDDGGRKKFMAKCIFQCFGLHDLAAGRVDEHGAPPEFLKEGGVCKMKSRMCRWFSRERRVEGDDVGTTRHFFQ